YDKDQMTGLFNRFCYEDKVIPLYQESLEKADPMTVMFVDINYMKLINDKFGHLHGDNAILTVVDAIRKSVPRDAVSVRFGGDEFLLIVPGCGPDGAQRIRESIARTLEQTSEEKKLPYQVTASIGYVVTDPAGRRDAELQDYIREADQVMYGIKKEMHEKNDRRKRS
nr:GGDEF domain-containing protein [Lachnospiraceae bacterium]